MGTFNPWLRRVGNTAISVRKIAPANVSRVIVKSRRVSRRFSRSHTRDVTAVFLQVICDLSRLELRCDPEITEKEIIAARAT
ncbi:MAG: hypothetical protein Udaeo2_00620 [Candidatus Udaeobacter sp.]|nr:MAG: hypothetical protein Udaeo2_00620 [Candidatus Udaeobacter sp.]